MPRQGTSVTGERRENFLGDVHRAVTIAADSSQRGAVNEIEMTLHQLGKGCLRMRFGIALQQLGVGGHGGHTINNAVCKTGQKSQPPWIASAGSMQLEVERLDPSR